MYISLQEVKPGFGGFFKSLMRIPAFPLLLTPITKIHVTKSTSILPFILWALSCQFMSNVCMKIQSLLSMAEGIVASVACATQEAFMGKKKLIELSTQLLTRPPTSAGATEPLRPNSYRILKGHLYSLLSLQKSRSL